MSERLNIEIHYKDKVLACVKHRWGGYTMSASTVTAEIIQSIVEHRKNKKMTDEEMLNLSVRLLVETGATFMDGEKEVFMGLSSDESLYLDTQEESFGDGCIAVSEEGKSWIRETEEARVEVHLDDDTINFNVVYFLGDEDGFKADLKNTYDKREANQLIKKYQKKGVPCIVNNLEKISFDDFLKFDNELENLYEKDEVYFKDGSGTHVQFIS